jgi:hypothetical protein
MSLDSKTSRLTKFGTVTVYPDKEHGFRIVVDGFEAEGCTCRDVTVQACLWAIGELQREALRSIEKPGCGSIGID